MFELLHRILMKLDRRVEGEINVGLQDCNTRYLIGLSDRETLLTSKFRYRPKLLRTEISEANELLQPFELISASRAKFEGQGYMATPKSERAFCPNSV